MKMNLFFLLFLCLIMVSPVAHGDLSSSIAQNDQSEYRVDFLPKERRANIILEGFLAGLIRNSFKNPKKDYLSQRLNVKCTKQNCEVEIFQLSKESYSSNPFQLRIDFEKSICDDLASNFQEAMFRSNDKVFEFLISSQGPCYLEVFNPSQFRDAELVALQKEIELFKKERKDRIQALLSRYFLIAETKELLKLMVEVDQKARGLWFYPVQNSLSPLRMAYFNRVIWPVLLVDEDHLPILKKLLTKYEWFKISQFGEQADSDAWLLVQHMDQDREFQARILGILEKLYPINETSAKNYAYLHDRLAEYQNRKQKYGTQGRCVSKGQWEPNELQNPLQVDQYRKEVGLEPLSEYKKKFISICP